MPQKFNDGHGWETLEQMKARKAREAEITTTDLPENLSVETTTESVAEETQISDEQQDVVVEVPVQKVKTKKTAKKVKKAKVAKDN